jgi:hypothetical protein
MQKYADCDIPKRTSFSKTKQNVQLKQLYPKRLTQGSKEHLCFSERRQACLLRGFFTSLHIFSIWFVSGGSGRRPMNSTSACRHSHSWITRQSWNGLFGIGLFHHSSTLTDPTIKCFEIRWYLKSSRDSTIRIPAHSWKMQKKNEQTTSTCGDRHISRVTTRSPWSVNYHCPIVLYYKMAS